MKTVGITSYRPTPYTVKVIELVKDEGYTPLVITNKINQKELSEILKISIENTNDIAIWVTDIDNPVKTASEIKNELSRRKITLSNWVNPSDYTTDTFLYAAEQLNIKFPFLEPYKYCRVKPVARMLAFDAGLSCATSEVIDISEPPRYPKKLKLPFVCKPITGTASQGVKLIENWKQWHLYVKEHCPSTPLHNYKILDFYPKRQVLLEDVLQGNECGIDGFIYQGHIYICTLSFKFCENTSNGPRELGGIFYRPHALSEYRICDDSLSRWTKELLENLEFNTGVFHIEAFWDGKKVDLIEVNPRAIGGGGVEMVQELSGVNLLDESVRLWLGMKYETKPLDGKKSIIFGHLYPYQNGNFINVKNEGFYQVELNNETVSGYWKPLIKEADEAKPKEEQYAGIFTINNPNNIPTLQDIASTVKLLNSQLKSLKLFEIK